MSVALQTSLFHLGLHKWPHNTINPVLQETHKLIAGVGGGEKVGRGEGGKVGKGEGEGEG